jgi:hypothetical protein
MLDSVEKTVRTDEPRHLAGPNGLSAANADYLKEFEAIKTLRDDYFRAHSLEVQEEKR